MPFVCELDHYPSLEELDKIYLEYSERQDSKIEGFVLNNCNQIEKYVRFKKTQKWFNELFSDEKVNIIRNFLIKRAIELGETSVIDLPDILKKHQEEIMKGNNNVLEFIEDFGKDNFENCSVKFIFDKYNLWCESNGEIALKNTNFNSTIESELRLKRDARRITQISDKDEEWGDLKHLEDSKRSIKCWVK